MKTKKIEQNGLTKKIGFGKSFYALVCGLAFALAGGSYFLVSAAGDIQIETNIDNAVQTIKRIIVTNDGTSSGTPYFDFNKNGDGGAIFKNILPGTIINDLGMDIDGNLVIENPPNNLDDGDWVMDNNNVYKTGSVAIGKNADSTHSYIGNLNILSSDLDTPELYIKQSNNSAANIHFVDMTGNVWSMGANPNVNAPYFYLGFNGGTNIFYVYGDGNAGINSNFTISGSLDMETHDIIDVNTVTAVAFVMSSDKSLKENIEKIKNPLDKIYALNGYTFDWKKDGSHDVGLIAQEVEKVLPELVHVDTNGHKGVQYSNMVALLIEGIKELGNKIDGLYDKYLDQQEQIDALEKRLQKLES